MMKDFYNRKDLNVESIVQLIRLWELDAGESFTDNCYFASELNIEFYEYLESRYPVLQEYCLQYIREDSWIPADIQDLCGYCEKYCTQWVPNDHILLWNEQYTLSCYPLAEFILFSDKAWLAFVEFFTSTNNTTSGTPWIDCYNIRQNFEEWMKRNI